MSVVFLEIWIISAPFPEFLTHGDSVCIPLLCMSLCVFSPCSLFVNRFSKISTFRTKSKKQVVFLPTYKFLRYLLCLFLRCLLCFYLTVQRLLIQKGDKAKSSEKFSLTCFVRGNLRARQMTRTRSVVGSNAICYAI